jgi:hypothetical protein
LCVSGKFLVAGEPYQENESERVACLKRENGSGMDVWRFAPANKKMRREIPN